MQPLPTVLAGPIVRRVEKNACHIWFVTSVPSTPTIALTQADIVIGNVQTATCLKVGEKAFIQLVSVYCKGTFTPLYPISYSIEFDNNEEQTSWQKREETLKYKSQSALSFHFAPQPETILHGSCRKPHYDGDDALAQVDKLIEHSFTSASKRPDILLMTGDQIYADDVAGPTLQAIQQVITQLGLFEEPLEGAVVSHSSELASHAHNFYEREQMLPSVSTNTALSGLFFGAKKKPVFTSVNAQNHLISGAEVLAMYFLVWSSELWEYVAFNANDIDTIHRDKFKKEQGVIAHFVTSLPSIQRALAHIPTYMIFDDHDVTDDWNLTRGWEEEVYANPFSKRMIGNALTGYLLCQGWGNAPEKCAPLIKRANDMLAINSGDARDTFIDTLFEFEDWDYRIHTTPQIEVLDTRTRRWRSESKPNKPSGLMDWEALCEFQQAIIGKDSVIVVSAAPIYGVKVIEAIQKLFTFFGKALTVDAENWMAHKGTANVMLNIFRHYKTPPEFIILSGDVHYSFVYDVTLRFRRNSPHITQFTCSGLKNAFPDKLIRNLDRLNRALYGPSSILNLFTRRRNMQVKPRKPSIGRGELLNGSAIGVLNISHNTSSVTCKALLSNGKEVEFPKNDDD